MSLFRRRFTPRGAAPGDVAPTEVQPPPIIKVVEYGPDHHEVRTLDGLDDLGGLEDRGHVLWIDVRGLGDGSVITELGERMGLHPLAISDVVNVGQRPKVDDYDGILFVVLRMATMGPEHELHWEQVSLFLGPHWVITFQETHEDCLEPLRQRIGTGRRQIRGNGAGYLAVMVIDSIVDGYFPLLEHYGDLLEDFEDRILEQKSHDVLADLYPTKRDLAGFRRTAWPLREALAQVLRDDSLPLDDVARLHLRDTLDHTLQVVEVNETYRELAASLVDVHLSMVGQRTNDIVRVLTVISAIFIPLTFVAGVYGMNFDTSHELNLPELGWGYGYPAFWGVCLLLAGSLLLLFRRLGWLSR